MTYFHVQIAMNLYLEPTPVIDSDHPEVVRFARQHTDPSATQVAQATALYYAVRDRFRYDPYRLDLSLRGMRASRTLELGYGWCVTKATLLAACCRAINIPSRIGFADVRNHLSTERLRKTMGTDIFHWHGYTSIRLDNQWVKATPAFNRELCEKMQIGTLEFNGREDSLYHPFDLAGQQHMEYILDRGEYADVPLSELKRSLQKYYPKLMDAAQANFDAEVEREASL